MIGFRAAPVSRALSAALIAMVLAVAALGVPPVGAQTLKLYKNPECMCCEDYAAYLRGHGFKVTVEATENLAAMQGAAGIPEGFEGCHMTTIEGYVVSGHVPMTIIERLLEERPAIRGITLPGMPAGAPGMDGPKEEPFVVFAIEGADAAGDPRVYATE
jgi:hypothetical protein